MMNFQGSSNFMASPLTSKMCIGSELLALWLQLDQFPAICFSIGFFFFSDLSGLLIQFTIPLAPANPTPIATPEANVHSTIFM